MATLGDVADWGSGGTPRRGVSEYFGEGVPWLSIADLNDGVVFDARESLTPSGIANSTAKVVPAGTLLIAMYGSIGKLGVAGREVCTSQAIAFAVPRRDKIDAHYLFHYLRAQRSALQALGRGGTQMNIGQADLKGWPIPLQPLAEQRRIAAILDQADALRAMRRQVLAHLDTLTQSIFHGMFGNPDDATDIVPFAEIAVLSGGRNLVAEDPAADSEYRVLKISAVTTGQFRPAESKPLPPGYVPPTAHLVSPGDLLMSRANTTDLVGAVAYVHETPFNLALPDKIWRFDWLDEQSVPQFFHALFNTAAVKRRVSRLSSGTGGSMKNISKANLASLSLPRVGPEKQRDFAARVERVQTQRAHAHRALAADDELFTSLQSHAFRGDV